MVELYKQHWWRCDGPCTKKPPFYGFVKRPMNRAPGPNDRWWSQHQQTCGGSFIKVKEPEGYGQKKGKKKNDEKAAPKKNDGKDIRKFFGGDKEPKGNKSKTPQPKMPKGLLDANDIPKSQPKVKGGVTNNVTGFNTNGSGPSTTGGGTSRSGGGPGVSGGGGRGNIFGFGGTSFSGTSGVRTKGKSGTIVVKPGQKTPQDNSSGGSVITTGSGHVVGTGSGHVVGTGSTRDSDDTRAKESAREAVRRKWAKANSNSSTSSSSAKTKTKDDKKTGHCPVCSKGFPEADINNHLDSCLGASDATNDEMDDGDDDLLLAASIELENSINNDRAIEISDDDDEPLVKRSLTNRHYDEN